MHIHTLPSSTTAPHPAVCPAPIVPNAMYRRMASPTSAAPSSSGSRPTTPRPRRASSWRASSLTLTTLSAASSGTRATRQECRVSCGGCSMCVCGASSITHTLRRRERVSRGAQEVPSVRGKAFRPRLIVANAFSGYNPSNQVAVRPSNQVAVRTRISSLVTVVLLEWALTAEATHQHRPRRAATAAAARSHVHHISRTIPYPTPSQVP